ncbi:hypothetical protein PoB_000085200 [Plakobranchus ocellatus]|uniref:Uncharacterized protein n=1 Tax=Plakobranchus ocellatus TaxID=259542 RepID=A0AAV3XWX2_9GAST|nr:hypothetical protein PoB_000085200 [Plakobranchus ocellatus]
MPSTQWNPLPHILPPPYSPSPIFSLTIMAQTTPSSGKPCCCVSRIVQASSKLPTWNMEQQSQKRLLVLLGLADKTAIRTAAKKSENSIARSFCYMTTPLRTDHRKLNSEALKSRQD